MADEQKIEETIQEKLQEAYGELLEHHNIQTGDITPEMKHEMDKAEEKITEKTQNWIETRETEVA